MASLREKIITPGRNAILNATLGYAGLTNPEFIFLLDY